jgi:fatty acid-binding protein DegV
VQKVLGAARAAKWIVDRVAEERDETLPLYFGNAEGEATVNAYRTKYAEALRLTGGEPDLLMGPVVATHSGPNCAGIAYFRKN